jgi:hypothetical protein
MAEEDDSEIVVLRLSRVDVRRLAFALETYEVRAESDREYKAQVQWLLLMARRLRVAAGAPGCRVRRRVRATGR